MEEMIYSGDGITKVLYTEDQGDGYKLVVLNIRGSHPCAYVQFPGVEELESYDDLVLNEEDERYNVCPHGGFTFLGGLEFNGFSGNWVGWDYAHAGDFTEWDLRWRLPWLGRKWTTEEVASEARKVLSRIKNGEYSIVNHRVSKVYRGTGNYSCQL